MCLSALTQSLRTHRRVSAGLGGRGVSSVDYHPYVDAGELRGQLARLAARLPEGGDADEDGNENETAGPALHFPVYVYDMRTLAGNEPRGSAPALPLLLDGAHHAVAFDDMVVAVRSGRRPYLLDHACSGNQRLQRSRDSDVRRSVLAAVLSGLWGVAPTHLRWDPLSGRTVPDWLWAVANTPFGPYSERPFGGQQQQQQQQQQLSFVQRDAAHRNQIFASVQDLLSELRGALAANFTLPAEQQGYRRQHHRYARVGAKTTPFWELFSAEEEARLQTAWAELVSELDKVGTYVSILDFDHATDYLRMARAAGTRMVRTLREVAAGVVPVVACSS